MTFVVDIPRLVAPSKDEIKGRSVAYENYIRSLSDQLPRGAFAYATSEWHSNYGHRMSPHDGWLERLTIGEPAQGTRREARSISITIELLGSHHDGLIRFVYPSVRSYHLQCPEDHEKPPATLGTVTG